MPGPWTIIGWGLLLAFVVLPAAAWAWARASERWSHLRSRNTPLRSGQVWVQDGRCLYIGERYGTGRYSISTGAASWGEKPEDWAQRVRNRRLWLLRDAPTGKGDGHE